MNYNFMMVFKTKYVGIYILTCLFFCIACTRDEARKEGGGSSEIGKVKKGEGIVVKGSSEEVVNMGYQHFE